MGVWGKKNFFQEVFFPHEKNKINKKGRTPDEGSPSSFAKAKEFTLSCVLVRIRGISHSAECDKGYAPLTAQAFEKA